MHPAIKAFIPILILGAVAGTLVWHFTSGNPINPDRIVRGDSFTYSQGPCFGACPTFDITVRSDDSFSYYGQEFMGKQGRHEGHFDDGSYRAIITLLAKYDFASLLDQYGGWDDSGDLVKIYARRSVCDSFATDMPSTDIRLESRQLTKALYYYEGCMGFADEERLKALIAALQQAVQLEYWLEEPE